MTAAGQPGGVRAPRPASTRWAAAARFAQSMKFIHRGGIYPARGTLRRRETPGWPPCFLRSVGRAFTPAAP